MITRLFIAENARWNELPVYNRMEFDERLDEQLDSGTVQTINDIEAAYEDYSLYRLQTTDTDGVTKDNAYFGFDTVEKRGEGYYIHTIEFVEITRIVMGMTIDGCKVTQPIEGEKKTLREVFNELLNKAKLISKDNTELYLFDGVGTVADIMEETISPEFHWECGTLLWECLCDIGNVINCIPRSKFVLTNTDRLFIDFDPINDITAEYEL